MSEATKQLRRAAGAVLRRLPFAEALRQRYTAVSDARVNRRFATAPKRFLIVRHRHDWVDFNLIVDWVERNVPEMRPLFELRSLPFRIRDWSRYVLHVPWLQDPVQNWSVPIYQQANALAAACDSRGIPIINRVDRLTNATKSTAAREMASLGIRTPRMFPIRNFPEFRETLFGLEMPFIIREDWGHGQAMIRVNTMADLDRISFEHFSRPIAVEYIDARSPHDGLFRKYRYLAIGDAGVAQHVHISRDWITRGAFNEFSDVLRDEELAYISGGDPHHELLQQARRGLGLDFLAFDYGYDREGRLVVWEANPHPYLHHPRGRRGYRAAALDRAITALLKLYLSRAGLPVPSEIDDRLAVTC